MGRFLTDTEDQRRVSVAFIGNDLRTRFFEGVDPIGKTIAIEGRPFEVVGVAAPLGSMFGQSRDTFVWIPVQTYFKMYGARRGFSITATAIDHAHFTQAQDEVRMLMRAFRGLRPKDEDNFSIFSSDSLLELWDQLTRVIAATAIAIVSVFMVVGGVVIMNIMLAVVTERTHEIGIRKSVGARQSDILSQFLVESLDAVGGWWGGGRLAGLGRGCDGKEPHAGSHGHALLGRSHRRWPVGRRGPVLRHLPCTAGGADGSDRGAEV